MVWDLGFIVGQAQRGKGLGSSVLKNLVTLAESKGLKPICSTEKDNIGAQKAIRRAGLFAGNRIIQFEG
ncbi:MAG: putative acetyltransferase [Desulforhopalus sp.]|jgi:predicted acetyltransferase